MNEDKLDNQDPIAQQKIAQLEKELEQIETKTSQEPQVVNKMTTDTVEAPTPSKAPLVQEIKPQGLKYSKGILWTAVVLLMASLLAAGAYLLL